MLFFPYLIHPHVASTAVSTLISCVISIYNAFIQRKNIPYKKIIPLIAGSLIMIPVAIHIAVLISGDFFKKLLGIVLVMVSIYSLFFNNRIKVKPSAKNGLIVGGISGILSGLFSTGGSPIVLYLMNTMTDNVAYFASTQFYFGIVIGESNYVWFKKGNFA